MTDFVPRRARMPRKPPARRPSGVVLLVVLVMLVVIGFTSVSVMRGALSADLVSNNERMQTLATQGAQIALRYCEAQVAKEPALRDPAFHLQDPPADGVAPAWETAANWSNAEIRAEVPDDWLEPDDNAVQLPAPHCIAERSRLGASEVIIVTARGFSPDYSAKDDGTTENGSVIWLQSILRLAAAP